MTAIRIQDQRKAQLISATIDSIAKRGLTETTITHICKGASLSRGIVNFYFDAKEKLMREVLASLLDEYRQFWQQALLKAPADTQAKLQAIIRAQFDKKLCAPKRLHVMSAFWGHAASHEAYRSQFEASDAEIIAACADLLQKSNVQNKAEAFERAVQLHAMIRGMWLRLLLNPKATDREALCAQCERFALNRPALALVGAQTPAPQRPKKAPARPKAADGQMDIEDLFANG